MLSQEPDSLNTATNTARAMLKKENLVGCVIPNIQNITMSKIGKFYLRTPWGYIINKKRVF
jgi:hypothetical protein